MHQALRSCTSRPRALLLAAYGTVLVSVIADVVAGSHPGHVAAVAAIAGGLGVVRLFRAGRHRVVFGLLSSGVVAQPVLHAADVISLSSLPVAREGVGADNTQSLGYVLVTALVIGGVGAAEFVARAAGCGAQSLCRLARLLCSASPIDSEPEVALPRTTEPRPRPRSWYRFYRRRGPPVGATA